MLPFREESKTDTFLIKKRDDGKWYGMQSTISQCFFVVPLLPPFLIVLVSSDDDAPLKSLSEVDTAVRVSVRRNDVVR